MREQTFHGRRYFPAEDAAGIVAPHPKQFWPILLKEYDVDGIEVWNPQSQRYTEFLISVLNRRNRNAVSGQHKLITLT